jgi:formamidopyrimidine-DNA glycosylase
MPELPEVQTTVNGLKDHITGLVISDVWTNYNSPYFKGSETIKDPVFFKFFKKEVVGKKVLAVERRAKNILIGLSGGNTILIHMKMTGHLLYGKYRFNKSDKKDPWEAVEPEGLKDPFNRRVRFLITFNNGKHLALSDTRKFAKVTLVSTKHAHDSPHLIDLGPEPLLADFTFEIFKSQLDKKLNWKIKQALMDQSLIAGIGNIYADESLWRAGIHPSRRVRDVFLDSAPSTSSGQARNKSHPEIKKLYQAIKHTLSKGIALGGDSMSDYRNIHGNKGNFQLEHRAYQRTGERCSKKGCTGTIRRIIVAGRATHYCDRHQE